MRERLTLVSFDLCPYVQRAAISMAEKGVKFERIYVDLSDKPGWFREISPLGKVPLLKAGDHVIFESAVILEYLEESQPNPLLPKDALERARHRAWVEFGSSILNDIAGFYSAPDETAFKGKAQKLTEKFERIERELSARPWTDGPSIDGPWFAGFAFGLVDTVFGPVFRYFEVFDEIADFGILSGRPRLAAWRRSLASRPSVAQAVRPDYWERLRDFLLARGSYLSRQMQPAGTRNELMPAGENPDYPAAAAAAANSRDF